METKTSVEVHDEDILCIHCLDDIRRGLLHAKRNAAFDLVVALTAFVMATPTLLGLNPAAGLVNGMEPGWVENYFVGFLIVSLGALVFGQSRESLHLTAVGMRGISSAFIIHAIFLVANGEHLGNGGTAWFLWYFVVGCIGQLRAGEITRPQNATKKIKVPFVPKAWRERAFGDRKGEG